MKKQYVNIYILLAFSGCAQLIDKTLNEFQAIASKDYEDHIKITWTTNNFYKHYQVLRSDSESGIFTPISAATAIDQFTDFKIQPGKPYYYKVRAYNNIKTPFFTTKVTEGFAGTLISQPPPTNLRTIEGQSPLKVVIEWDNVDDADAYKVYRSENPKVMTDPNILGAGWKEVDIVRYPIYEDTDVIAGSYYYYRIGSILVREDGSFGPVSSGFSNPIQGYTFGGDIGLSSMAGSFKDRIELKWLHLPTVTEYIIYRSTDKDFIGTQIHSIPASEGTIYSDYSAKPNTIYYYTILYKNNYTMKQSQKIKSYKKTDNAPSIPQNFIASQGKNNITVTLSWNKVNNSTGYSILRSGNINGPYEEIATIEDSSITSYEDTPPNDFYVYYYKISAFNPAPGPETLPIQGWANRPPANITASANFGNKVVLEWDIVPGARQYNIDYSTSENGNYQRAGIVTSQNGNKVTFNHVINIGDKQNVQYFYRIQVTAESVSEWSVPIIGKIQKIGQPQNLRIRNNRTATERTLNLEWNRVPNAEKYHIYRATLKHSGAQADNLSLSDYKYVASVNDTGYQSPLNTVPLRRYVYRVVAVDAGGAEGVGATSEIAYRLPINIDEFLQDIDFTIIHAQTQIKGFGDNGSGGNVRARYQGTYNYNAKASGSRSKWDNYTSFEVKLNGDPSIKISFSPLGAYMNGTVYISGLYSGSVTYNNLLGVPGGYTVSGSITAVYNHPTEGTLRKSYSHTDAGFLKSVVLKSERKPIHREILLLFEDGSGD